MEERQPITKKGYENLRVQIKQLMEIERPKIVKDIEVARSYGDLKENAEYHSAKEKQGMIEAKLQQLNDMLVKAEVIDVSKMQGDTVKFGAKVSYENLDSGENQSYYIVGPAESDINKNRISITSPIGRALIGKSVDDEVMINIPKGKIEIVITEISFPDE